MLHLLLALSLVRLKPDATDAGVASGFSQTAQARQVVTDIRVQGNVLTPDEEMQRLTGVAIGAPFSEALPEQVAERLKATHKFKSVEVRKRYASLTDDSQVVLVVIVNEGPVSIEGFGDPGTPSRVVRRRGLGLLWFPLLDFEDGYGFSYGVQLAKTKIAGPGSRLSFPLTWGGTRQAAAQLEETFTRGPLTRVEVGAGVVSRTNPFFQQDDDRERLWVLAERAITPQLRVSGTAGWQHVTFLNTSLNASDRFTHAGAAIAFDTRLDPMLARNAVNLRASIDHFDFQHASAATRTELDGSLYVGLVGQNILVVRALRQDSDVPLPPYLRPLLGGMANLRGFRAGSAIGDTLVSGSAEIRAPLTSPLGIAKAGVSAFVDIGTIYAKGQRLSDQHFSRGLGGGVWFTAAFFRLSLVVAHGVGAGTRVHFGTTVTF